MFCSTGDRAFHNTRFSGWARHTFYYRIAPPGDIRDLSEVETAGIAAPSADDDGRVGRIIPGLHADVSIDAPRPERQPRLGAPGTPAIDPFSKWLWNNDGMAGARIVRRTNRAAASRGSDPFPPSASPQRKIISARRRFLSMNSGIHQDDEENPASGFRPQLNPNRL